MCLFKIIPDWGIGPHNGSKNTLNFQPVIPIKLSANLNLITRYIIPIVDQRDVADKDTHEFGLSDATVSAFFSPSHPKGGLIWGIGPALLIPIATNDYLSTKKFGVGPTALVLKQGGGNTMGFLVNQIWSVAGDKERQDVNQLFLQPFFAHSFPTVVQVLALIWKLPKTGSNKGHNTGIFKSYYFRHYKNWQTAYSNGYWPAHTYFRP